MRHHRSPLVSLLVVAAIVGMPTVAHATPMSLDDLVKAALRDHPTLTSAREAAVALRHRASAAGSPYWPQVALNTGTSATTQVSQAQNTAAPFNLSTVGATVRQQLWDFGKTTDEVTAAEEAAQASQMTSESRRVDIAFGVRKAYLEWLRACGLQTQVESRQKAATALYRQADAFWKAGRRAKLDVTRADASLQQANADVIGARNTAQVALLTLGAAIGRSGSVEAETAFPQVPALAEAPMSELTKLADHHPLIRQSAARLHQSEANHRRADKGNWPDITADVSYGVRARDLVPSQNWSAGVTMNVPVFNGFADWRDRDATAAQERASRADTQSQRLTVMLGIEQARLTGLGARERLAALGAAVRSAEANMALAEGRYKAGVGSVIEVSDAQSLLSTTQADRVRGEADYHLAVADLLRALGTTGVE
ncbi:MAG: TolC family protein [Candidatus Sericytochromatia bacterium]|nr:TolC family protein [Candidatus Sericytochromatia bacterium]